MAASTSLKRHATDMARSALKNQLQAETQLIKCDGRLSKLSCVARRNFCELLMCVELT
jgi:hypothetical protein